MPSSIATCYEQWKRQLQGTCNDPPHTHAPAPADPSGAGEIGTRSKSNASHTHRQERPVEETHVRFMTLSPAWVNIEKFAHIYKLI